MAGEVYDFYCDELEWCLCGKPEEALGFLRDVLRAMRLKDDDKWAEAREAVDKLLPLDSPLGLCFRYWMDSRGWTEHGGAVYGAWLTDEGRRVLALLNSEEDLEAAMEDEWEKSSD